MNWKTIDSAPKDRTFLAWYESPHGPKFGNMVWEPEIDKKTLKPHPVNGRFQSNTMGTQTKCATHWMDPEAPRGWGPVTDDLVLVENIGWLPKEKK